MSPWCEFSLKLYHVQGAVITYIKIKVAMKRRHFSAMILSLSRKGLRVAQCLCMELTTEESKRREYKRDTLFIFWSL